MAEQFTAHGIDTRNDGAFFSRMAVWDDGWVDAPGATAMTAAAMADWDPAEALAGLGGSDRFVDGVEWFLADRELKGRAADLARFGLLWVDGALVVAGHPDRISLAGTAAYEEGAGGNLVPIGGYRMLVERLAAGVDVRLETRVSRVEHGGPEVAVHADGETFEGDRVVVTVPLGVLRNGSIAFDPPLPGDHVQAVERLEMATLEKVALRFPERFWPESVWQITHVAGDLAFPVWFDFSRHTGSPTLVGFYNPAIAPGLAELTAGRGSNPRSRSSARFRPGTGARGDTSHGLDRGSVGTRLLQLRAARGERRRHAPPGGARLRPAAAGRRGHGAESYGTVHAAFRSGLRAAGWVA